MSKDQSQTESTEARILRAVRFTLTRVIKDTATEPGMKHPLSDETIAALRNCLVLISEREQELGTGGESTARPRYVDEPRKPGPVAVSLDQLKPPRKD